MKRLIFGFMSVFMLIACFPGCSRRDCGDFSFRIKWGVTRGESSYDSENGVLIKTTNASDPDKFWTRLKLSRRELTELSDLVSAMDFSAIPDAPTSYEPYITEGIGWAMAKPPNVLELTLRTEQGEKTILCRGALSALMEWDTEVLYEPIDANGEAFIALVHRIIFLIQNSEEWKALPDYEVLYE